MTDRNLPEWQLAQWTLDVEGKKIGPFTPEQVLGFLQEGEILGHHKATSPGLEGEWVTVEELIAAFESARNRDAEAPESTAEPVATLENAEETTREPKKKASGFFTPPPRPKELPIPELPALTPPDPARDLFDVFQAARSKKSGTKFTPPLVESTDGTGGPGSPRAFLTQIPRQVRLIGAITLSLGFLIWAISAMLGPDEPATPVVQRESRPKAVRKAPAPPKAVPRTQVSPKSVPKVAPKRTLTRPSPTPRAAPPSLKPRPLAPRSRRASPDSRDRQENVRGYEEPFYPNDERTDQRDPRRERDDFRERDFPEEGDFPPDAEPRQDGSRYNEPLPEGDMPIEPREDGSRFNDPRQDGNGYDEPVQDGGYPNDQPQTMEFYESGP